VRRWNDEKARWPVARCPERILHPAAIEAWATRIRGEDQRGNRWRERVGKQIAPPQTKTASKPKRKNLWLVEGESGRPPAHPGKKEGAARNLKDLLKSGAPRKKKKENRDRKGSWEAGSRPEEPDSDWKCPIEGLRPGIVP